MSSRVLLTVRRETSVDAVLAAELDAMFDEGTLQRHLGGCHGTLASLAEGGG